MNRVPQPTTKRKPLTKLRRAAMFAEHEGKCVICGLPIIGKKWIDEHIKALGLNGTNDMKNRGPAHLTCAAVKTHDEDMPHINKAKAQAAAAAGRDPEAPRIRGRKFRSDKPLHEPKPKLPPKRLYA